MSTPKTTALRIKNSASRSRARAEDEPRSFPITSLLGNVLLVLGLLGTVACLVAAMTAELFPAQALTGAIGGLVIAASGEALKLLASSHRLLRIIAIEAQGAEQHLEDWKQGANAS